MSAQGSSEGGSKEKEAHLAGGAQGGQQVEALAMDARRLLGGDLERLRGLRSVEPT